MPSRPVMKAIQTRRNSEKTIYLVRFERGPYAKQFLAAWTEEWTYIPTRLPANASTFTSALQAKTAAACLDLLGLVSITPIRF
jgi:hypothetical protein